MVLEIDLCVGATVAFSGINIVPEAGLYNGARGTIINFILHDPCGPKDKHGEYLPSCLIVDFPGLKLGTAKPWDELNPTVSNNMSSCIVFGEGGLGKDMIEWINLSAVTPLSTRECCFDTWRNWTTCYKYLVALQRNWSIYHLVYRSSYSCKWTWHHCSSSY